MIGGFRHKGLRQLYENRDRSKVPQNMMPRIERVLAAMDVATDLADLANPSFRLHELKGDRAGTWSMKVTGNWRITFRAGEPFEPHDLDLEDYH